MSTADSYFSPESVDRARRYNRPRYVVQLLDAALIGLAFPALLAFGALGAAFYAPVEGLAWPLRVVCFTGLIVVASGLLSLPSSYWRVRHDRRFGLSVQSDRGWLADRAKGLAIGIVLSAALMLALVGSARLFPTWWPVVAASGAALFVVVAGFVAPVLLEPVFNRFRPLPDPRLAAELRALALRAGVPVREVLVADASRRTRKHNAYVSGLGRTRRVVVWDTLLDDASPAELRLVVAHELGHRRFRHVAWGTAIAMAGSAVFVLVLWALLEWNALLDALGVTGAADPRVVPFVILLGGVFELLTMPFQNALSRRFERTADRFSIELTGDRDAYEEVHRRLATANLTDLDPPRAFHLVFHSHPTPPERLAAGRAGR